MPENKEEPKVEGYEVKTLVSADGRVSRTVTSKDEEDDLRNSGYKEGGDEALRNRERIDPGAEGNRKAAEASTTRKDRDGVDRKATSER